MFALPSFSIPLRYLFIRFFTQSGEGTISAYARYIFPLEMRDTAREARHRRV